MNKSTLEIIIIITHMNSTTATTTHSQSKTHSETFEKAFHHTNNWYTLLNIIQFIKKMKQINTHTLLSPDDIDISIEKIKTQRTTPLISSRIKEKEKNDKAQMDTISQLTKQLQLFECVSNGNEFSLKYIKKLIKENKEMINSKNYEGFTPLYISCMNGYIKVVELLIELGADHLIKCGKEKEEQSILEVTCRFGYVNILQLLLSKCKWPYELIRQLKETKWDNKEIRIILKHFYNKTKRAESINKCFCFM